MRWSVQSRLIQNERARIRVSEGGDVRAELWSRLWTCEWAALSISAIDAVAVVVQAGRCWPPNAAAPGTANGAIGCAGNCTGAWPWNRTADAVGFGAPGWIGTPVASAAAAAANAAPPTANCPPLAVPGVGVVFELLFKLRSLRVAHCAKLRVFWFFALRPAVSSAEIVSRSRRGKIGSAKASTKSLQV